MCAVYVFNPEHDLALANGGPNFDPPLSAFHLRRDLECLPIWYAEHLSKVLVFNNLEEWLSDLQQLFPCLQQLSFVQSVADSELIPWGWNSSLNKQFPFQTDDFIQQVRAFSHRKTTVVAMDFLRENCSFRLPLSAQCLTSLQDVEHFSKVFPQVVFKAPWSGSGKGIFRSKGMLTESLRGWCRRIIEKQGCVMGELAYDKVVDFAMEFEIRDGNVSFLGYSLFKTEGMGIYKGNLLCSDDVIEHQLLRLLPSYELLEIRRLLTRFFTEAISFYSGFVGVDMLIFKTASGNYALHPMVEINLRTTMGVVAHRFYNSFVHPTSQGFFVIDRFETPEDLAFDHTKRKKEHPLVVENGRMIEGYLSLCPILEKTTYRVRVEIENKSLYLLSNFK